MDEQNNVSKKENNNLRNAKFQLNVKEKKKSADSF